MASLKEMPFGGLTNREFFDFFNYRKQHWDDIMMNNTLRDKMNHQLYGNDVFQNMDCNCMTPDHLNHTFTSKCSASRCIMRVLGHPSQQCERTETAYPAI